MKTKKELLDAANELQNQINSRIEGLEKEQQDSEQEHEDWEDGDQEDEEPSIIDHSEEIEELQTASDCVELITDALS